MIRLQVQQSARRKVHISDGIRILLSVSDMMDVIHLINKLFPKMSERSWIDWPVMLAQK